jgi:hypothetical protein
MTPLCGLGALGARKSDSGKILSRAKSAKDAKLTAQQIQSRKWRKEGPRKNEVFWSRQSE